MKYQVQKMLEAENDPTRKGRAEGADFPWMSPVFAVGFALGKLSRIVKFNHRSIHISDAADERTMAEELREAASYLLRAASLIDPDEYENDQTTNYCSPGQGYARRG